MDKIETHYRIVTSHGVLDVGYGISSFQNENKGEYYIVGKDGKQVFGGTVEMHIGKRIPYGVFKDILDNFGPNIDIAGVLSPKRMLYGFENFDINVYYDPDLDHE